MKKIENTQYFSLPCGVRALHCRTNSQIAHLAFIFNIGSRDESPYEHGMAHYIEHCAFKGTKKRKAYHILSRMEDIGGELNAFTSKEDICIHSSFMPEYLDRAMELISDISFGSTYPQKEIEKEKGVIVDEINSYKESPAELIFEHIDAVVFGSHPLGNTILGTQESVNSFTRDGVVEFLAKNFSADRMIVCVSGDFPTEKIKATLEKHLSKHQDIFSRKSNPQNRTTPSSNTSQNIVKTMETHQSHIIMGGNAFGVDTDEAVPMSLLNNLMGGPSMSARLNLSLRERHALVYNVESFFTPFCDCGLAGIYLGTDKQSVGKSIELVHRELRAIRDNSLGSLQLSKAKRQMMGQLAISSENNLSQLLAIGKSYLVFERADDFSQMMSKIENVTASKILELANIVYDKNKLSTIIYNSDKN